MAVDFGRNGLGEVLVRVAGLLELGDAAEEGGVDLHLGVGLLVLDDVVGLEVGVGEKTGAHGLEAGVRGGEEDAGNVDNVTGVDLADERAVGENGKRTGDLADGHLLGEFLDLDLLEGQELGRPRRRVQLALGLVLLAVLRWAESQGGVLLVGDGLEDFATAAVASVGANLDDGLDVGHTGGDTTDGDEMAEVVAAYLTDGQGFLRSIGGHGPGLEDEGVAAGELGRVCVVEHVGVAQVLGGLGEGAVALLAVGHKDVEHIVLECDILAGRGHQLVDGARQDLDVVLGVALYRLNQLETLVDIVLP